MKKGGGGMYPDMNLAPGSRKDLCLDWTRSDLQGLISSLSEKNQNKCHLDVPGS